MVISMLVVLIALLVSFVSVLFIVRFERWHGSFSMDRDLNGIQKVHAVAVPRIGGAGVIVAVAASLLLNAFLNPSRNSSEALILLGCSLPAFLSGFAEDLTKKISPRTRLIASMIAALLACFALRAVVTRVNFSYVDAVLVFSPIAIALTVFSVSGVVHAINIIDGLNGLASVVAIIILASIGLVAFHVGDSTIVIVSLTLIGAITGFLAWNFPISRVFLGDGGAYFIGFLIAELLILLTMRNPSISPLYAILVTIYPVFETVFSIYRRKLVRGLPAGAPDAVHLHTLVYRRVLGGELNRCDSRALSLRNSRTSPYLWTLTLCAVVPATLFSESPVLLGASALLFIATYVWLYAAIVRFHVPAWLRPAPVKEQPIVVHAEQ
ncbi:glycosyltransferase [Caballeronia sp. GAWG2-1]|uniref:MraY family glycosyltransferase n=1 Tax=Caballeronia sp. GAWG2-1 TaxID=2921744 RepID=UPI00202969C7